MSSNNGTPERGRPRFTGVVPVVNVKNVGDSLRYYTEVLGFEKAWVWSDTTELFEGENPDFACIRRGDVSFFLDHGMQGNPGAWCSLFLDTLEELSAMHHEYMQSGARITSPPEDKVWGMREMLVEDLDGNVFRIGTALPQG